MEKIIEKIVVVVNGEKKKEYPTMLEALEYVHSNCVGQKVKLLTERSMVNVN